jgi:leucyl/phenylalanyl-tRNA--protein transferase
MFHTKTDASKVAFVSLVEQLKNWGYQLIDCQVHTRHLESLGAEEINRRAFVQLLKQYCPLPVSPVAWQ